MLRYSTRFNRRSATAPALPRPPITVHLRVGRDETPGVTDEAIGQAIQRGVTNLLVLPPELIDRAASFRSLLLEGSWAPQRAAM